MKPSICAAIIGRNEERDLPKCLASLKGVADRIVYVDTGSTDDTLSTARRVWAECNPGREWLAETQYFDASEPNPDRPGEYRIVNFAKARNFALEMAEATGCSHIFWMDCDDEVITPLAIRRAAYLPDAVYSMWVEVGGGVRQAVPRLWPAAFKIRYHGWVHEWAEISKFQNPVLNDCGIRHNSAPHESAGEDSNQRNLRILTAQYAAQPDARTAFYLANTHKDGGRWRQAAEWYTKRLGYGEGFRDEFLFSMLYLARSLRFAGEKELAETMLREALEKAPDWQEFRMELAFMQYDKKDYPAAIDEARRALRQPIPETVLWRERQMYTDQPARLISWAHEHLGNYAQALVWSHEATRLIGAPDGEWARREARLEVMQGPTGATSTPIVKGLRHRVALHRPGAIGDILMTLNLIPAFKEANPDADVHYFCDAKLAAPDALGSIMLAAGVDLVMDCASLPSWRKHYDRVIDLIGYPLAEGYPDKPMRFHLLNYFAEEMGLDVPYRVDGGINKELPALTLRRPEGPSFGDGRPYATIQRRAGWSKYKQWQNERWTEVQTILLADPDILFVEIDESMGKSLAWSISAFANARMHIGIDSFCNHLTNYYWTDERGGRRVPGVILWGSTQASAAGYPSNINISKGLSCQPCFRENDKISRMPRGPCINPPRPTYDDDTPWKCMDSITVEEVVEAVRTLWKKVNVAD